MYAYLRAVTTLTNIYSSFVKKFALFYMPRAGDRHSLATQQTASQARRADSLGVIQRFP